MISIVVIGYGNVAHHLVNAFLNTEKVKVLQVYNRTIKKINHLSNFTKITDDLNNLVDADVYIISVTDGVISAISSKINIKNTLVVHTSGSVAMSSLQNKGRKGVFYPLQSFSRGKEVNFKEIPFCLEATTEDDLVILEKLALAIGKNKYHITSKQRKHLHVAAVFVNNFVNHLYKIGNDICETNNVPFEILQPLIKETASKIKHLNPKDAQTGPAKRNDKETINNHLDLLNKKQQEIYNLITKSIQNG